MQDGVRGCLKRSGMTWRCAGGQVVVDLRVLRLSGVWTAAHEAFLRSRPEVKVVKQASNKTAACRTERKVA